MFLSNMVQKSSSIGCSMMRTTWQGEDGALGGGGFSLELFERSMDDNFGFGRINSLVRGGGGGIRRIFADFLGFLVILFILISFMGIFVIRLSFSRIPKSKNFTEIF